MTFKKLILSILIMISIINIDYKSYAKYVFEYVQLAAEISINN